MEHSLEFICTGNKIDKRLSKMKYPDLLQYEAQFVILIDNQEYFSDNYFPILEFLREIKPWLNNETEDFIFECTDTEDNPLISILKKDNMLYEITSKWELFNNNVLFSKDTITTEIFSCIKMLGILIE